MMSDSWFNGSLIVATKEECFLEMSGVIITKIGVVLMVIENCAKILVIVIATRSNMRHP